MHDRRDHPLVFVDSLDAVQLDQASEKHLTKSLRLKPGDPFFVSDGRGHWRKARLGVDGFSYDGAPEFEEAPVVRRGVAFTPVKGDKSSWIVQKLTELNIDNIVLLETDRSVVRWDAQRKQKQLEKLGRVAIEACGQSRRVWTPDISFGSLSEVLTRPGAVMAEPGGRSITDGDYIVAVGPEGGWSQRETELGVHVGLPGGILRAETAALAAAVQIGSFAATYS